MLCVFVVKKKNPDIPVSSSANDSIYTLLRITFYGIFIMLCWIYELTWWSINIQRETQRVLRRWAKRRENRNWWSLWHFAYELLILIHCSFRRQMHLLRIFSYETFWTICRWKNTLARELNRLRWNLSAAVII